MQETFLNAHRALPSFRNTGGYASWLYRIATNTCISSWRRKQRKPVVNESVSRAQVDNSPDPHRIAAARQLLRQMIDTFDDRDVAIIVQHYIAGMDQTQVAESLSISRRAVAKRIRKIRDRMGQRWPEEFGHDE